MSKEGVSAAKSSMSENIKEISKKNTWWLERISNNIKYIFDLGYKDDSLYNFLESVYPGRFKYIGIKQISKTSENSAKNTKRYRRGINIIESLPDSVPEGSILLVGSAVHNLFSQFSSKSSAAIINNFFSKGFEYIIVDDIHSFAGNSLPDISLPDYLKEKYKESCKKVHHLTKDENETEFLLKYFSEKEEWEKNCGKRYFYSWSKYFKDEKYEKIHESKYFDEELAERLKKDNIIFSPKLKTHKRLIFEKT